MKQRLLFVCVENSCRSQMAEAFARMLAGDGAEADGAEADAVEAYSAGSRPSGVVDPLAIEAMGELGYDLRAHASTSIDDAPPGPYDAVITMGCGDECPHVPAARHEDWAIPDPKDLPLPEFRLVRDEIRVRVARLLSETGRGSVLLVAGGRSTRLGREKPWVRIGDRTVFARQLHAARPFADVIVSVRDPRPFADALVDAGWLRRGENAFGLEHRRLRLAPDPAPDLGPVAGLAAGLAIAAGDGVAVFSGDLPFLTAGWIEALLSELEVDPDCDAVIPVVQGRDQPLCAAYRSRVAGVAEASLAGALAPRGPSVLGLIDRLNVRRVTSVGRYGPTELAEVTRGVDTPEDREWALRIAKRPHD